MGEFFGTNGIRGTFGEDLTLEFVHDMALAIGTVLGSGKILVGRDGRESSRAISKTVCAALNSIGIDCGDAGLVPTPCLEYAVKRMGHSGGIMITASHNPPEYNGLKPVASDGVEFARSDENAVEEAYRRRAWAGKPPRWGVTSPEGRAVRTYLDGVASRVDSDSIRSGRFKVALDIGNGAQAVTAPELCSMLGCSYVLVNEDVDGLFPGRGSEPTPENLGGLSNAVRNSGADIGVAFDGDGDRSVFCDECGRIMSGDMSALVLTRHLLRKEPGSAVVTCINSGSAIEELASEYGSQVVRTKVGSVEVSRAMVSTGAPIGFEENGGFMYGPHNQVRDGCMALAIMLDALSASGTTLSEEAATVPASYTAKTKVPCPAGDAARLIGTLADEFPDADMTDGIKITLGAKEWAMVRPSGTEPIARIYAEAVNQARLESLLCEYAQKASSAISGGNAEA